MIVVPHLLGGLAHKLADGGTSLKFLKISSLCRGGQGWLGSKEGDGNSDGGKMHNEDEGVQGRDGKWCRETKSYIKMRIELGKRRLSCVQTDIVSDRCRNES